MAGFKEPAQEGAADLLQQDVQDYVCELAIGRYPDVPCISRQAALSRLLQGRSPYLAGAGPTRVA
eukprot:3560332-Alexandrium_andersonii.AAC.1